MISVQIDTDSIQCVKLSGENWTSALIRAS